MIPRPPRSTRTDTLFPYTTLFRSRIREELAAIEGELMSLTYSTYRATSHDIHGRDIGWFQTMPKLYMTELAGRIAKLARDIVEDDFTDMGGARLKWIERFMISLSMSIAGGTSNITRNIIAERSLGERKSTRLN